MDAVVHFIGDVPQLEQLPVGIGRHGKHQEGIDIAGAERDQYIRVQKPGRYVRVSRKERREAYGPAQHPAEPCQTDHKPQQAEAKVPHPIRHPPRKGNPYDPHRPHKDLDRREYAGQEHEYLLLFFAAQALDVAPAEWKDVGLRLVRVRRARGLPAADGLRPF